MATISIPLGVNTVVRASDGHLAIDNGTITVIFAFHSDTEEARRELDLIITGAQSALGQVTWRSEDSIDPLSGLAHWASQSSTPRIENG